MRHSFHARPTRFPSLLAAALLLLLALATPSYAADASPCDGFSTEPDGTYRDPGRGAPGPGGLSASPPRIVGRLHPGDTARYCVGFRNRSPEAVDLSLRIAGVALDDAGNPVPAQAGTKDAAADWVELPTQVVHELAINETAWIPVEVAVPTDATGGTSYLVLTGTSDGGHFAAGGSGVDTSTSISVQLFLDLPGGSDRVGDVVDVDAPHVIWWDGVSIGDLPVVDRVRGLGIATERFHWRNRSAHTDRVRGHLIIRSSLTNRVVERIPVPPRYVLRDSSREFAVTWSHGVPLVGRFEPTLELTDGRGHTVETRLDAIWVVPAWWYLLALVLAIGFPTRGWIHRRRLRNTASRAK